MRFEMVRGSKSGKTTVCDCCLTHLMASDCCEHVSLRALGLVIRELNLAIVSWNAAVLLPPLLTPV
jgi:hypothetical protein